MQERTAQRVRVVLRVPEVPAGHAWNISPVALDQLRTAWREADAARRNTTNAQKHRTDPQVVYGCLSFAIEHLAKAIAAIEDVGQLMKKKFHR